MVTRSIIALGVLLAGFATAAEAGEREGRLVWARARIGVSRAAPRHMIHRPLSYYRYVRGHYEYRTEKVWVPGYYRTESVPAVYSELRGRFGRIRLVLIRPSCTRKVWVAGYYETKTVRVWVPGRYVRMRSIRGRCCD